MPVVNLFKYKVWLDILTGCPPLEYVEVAIQAFRFVHSAGHPDNFKPVQLLNPARKFENQDIQCKALGISMFDDKNTARLFFKKRSAKAPLFGKIVGFQIATFTITVDDGVASDPEQNNFGHFTFHEYIWGDFQQKIENIEPILST